MDWLLPEIKAEIVARDLRDPDSERLVPLTRLHDLPKGQVALTWGSVRFSRKIMLARSHDESFRAHFVAKRARYLKLAIWGEIMKREAKRNKLPDQPEPATSPPEPQPPLKHVDSEPLGLSSAQQKERLCAHVSSQTDTFSREGLYTEDQHLLMKQQMGLARLQSTLEKHAEELTLKLVQLSARENGLSAWQVELRVWQFDLQKRERELRQITFSTCDYPHLHSANKLSTTAEPQPQHVVQHRVAVQSTGVWNGTGSHPASVASVAYGHVR